MLHQIQWLEGGAYEYLMSSNPNFEQVFFWAEDETRGEKVLGHQFLPDQWREISANQYHYKLVCETPIGMIRTSFMADRKGNMLEKFIVGVIYVFQDGTGVGHGYSTDVQGQYYGLSYYTFGCEHQYRDFTRKECQEAGYDLSRRQFLSKCVVCGHVYKLI